MLWAAPWDYCQRAYSANLTKFTEAPDTAEPFRADAVNLTR
jgi:hypothetical protein